MNQNKIPKPNIYYLFSLVNIIAICIFLVFESSKLGFEGLFKRPMICIFLFPISVAGVMAIREFLITFRKKNNKRIKFESKKFHIVSLVNIICLSLLLVSEWSKMGLEKLTTRPGILFLVIVFALLGLGAIGELLRVMIKSSKEKISILAIIVFNINIVFAQHPNDFISDVYTNTWCIQQNIKEASIAYGSSKSDYYCYFGTMVPKWAKNVKINENNNGEIIVLGRNRKVWQSKKIDLQSNQLIQFKKSLHPFFYFYDDNNAIQHMVNHLCVDEALTEFIRDEKGLLIRKEIYHFKDSIMAIKHDLQKIKEKNGELHSIWNYVYDENDLLRQVEVIRRNWETKNIEVVNILLVEHENGLPCEILQYSKEIRDQYFQKKETFTYVLED